MLLYEEKKSHMMSVLFRARSLSSSEKLVALSLIWLTNEQGWSSPSSAELAEMSRLHERTVRYTIRSLEKKIDLNFSFSGRRNRYRFPQWDYL
jgi:hypothetical protein